MADEVPAQHVRDHRHERARRPTWYSILGQVIAWMIAVTLFGLIAALVLVPRLVGATPYTILTGSMVPTMPPGTVVVDRPEPFSSIRTGDVLTYQLVSGKPDVVTHRVIGINVESDGSQSLTMKGDANPSPDLKRVIPKQVRGVVWYSIPLVGYFGAIGSADTRSVIAKLIGVALIAYALYVILAALIRGRKPQTGDSPAGDRRREPT